MSPRKPRRDPLPRDHFWSRGRVREGVAREPQGAQTPTLTLPHGQKWPWGRGSWTFAPRLGQNWLCG
jgi:hypothetical protein